MKADDKLLSDFEHDGRRAFYRPTGHVEAEYLVELITFVLSDALQLRLTDALISIIDVEGFESPPPSFRAWAVKRWAEAVAGQVSVAIVANEEHICPKKIGLIVAAEEGLHANIFTSEREAIAWLDSESNSPSAQ
jgi:hypothetical protein